MNHFQHIFLIGLALSFLLTPLMRLLAFRMGTLDHPKAHGIHNHPVPRIGGIAIYLAFVTGALWQMDLSNQLKGVLVGSTVIFAVGLWDDFFGLKAKWRLFIQIAALWVMMFKYHVMLDLFENKVLNGFFTALGIIGITNAVNFLDNMDGLATGLVMISSAAIFYVAFLTHQVWLGYLTVALIAAGAGFLVHNLRRAHVFMGDSGATFLGFTLASLAVMADWSKHLAVTMAVPLLILGVPVLDMLLITVLRIKEHKVKNFKQWIDYAGKDHLSHRIARLGFSNRKAVFIVWGLQAVFCALALWIFPRQNEAGVFGLIFYLIAAAAAVFFFRRRRYFTLRLSGRPSKKRKDKALPPARSVLILILVVHETALTFII